MLRRQTLDLLDRTSDRVPSMGQLRGHINIDPQGHIRNGWVAGNVQRWSLRSLQEKEDG